MYVLPKTKRQRLPNLQDTLNSITYNQNYHTPSDKQSKLTTIMYNYSMYFICLNGWSTRGALPSIQIIDLCTSK